MAVQPILLVDDDRDTLSIYDTFLSFNGYVVETASTAAEAIEKARAARALAVLLDLRLPDISGLDLMARWREEVETRDVPVICFSTRQIDRRESGLTSPAVPPSRRSRQSPADCFRS